MDQAAVFGSHARGSQNPPTSQQLAKDDAVNVLVLSMELLCLGKPTTILKNSHQKIRWPHSSRMSFRASKEMNDTKSRNRGTGCGNVTERTVFICPLAIDRAVGTDSDGVKI